MNYSEDTDNIGLVADLKKEPILFMASAREKELFKKAAARDERGLSDWFRWLGRNRARELGLKPAPDEAAKPDDEKSEA